MKSLREYLKTGNRTLIELNYLSPGAVGGNLPAMMTGRGEKMRASWEELMIKFNTLWLDVLDNNDRAYEEAKPLLDEMKNATAETCRSSVSKFRNLHAILSKSVYTDKYAEDKDMKLYLARMTELQQELDYICDEYDPDRSRIPEAPARNQEDWERRQKELKKGDAQADITYTSSGIAQQGPQIPDVPKEREFLADRPGKDGAGPSTDDKGKSRSSSKKTSNGKKKTPSGKEDAKKARDSEKNSRSGKPKKSLPRSKKKKQVEENQPLLPSVPKKESERNLPPSCPSVVMASLAKAASSLAETHGIEHLESAFVEAGDAVRLCLEEWTDVAEAYVEVGQAVPGHTPRLDVFFEWENRGRPSDCYGYARLWFQESEGATILDANDKVRDIIRMDEEVTDDEFALRVYQAASQIYDVSPKRIHSEARVAPALYRLLEKFAQGEQLPEYAFAQILSSLRARVGLHENVRMVPQEIRLELSEDFSDVWNYHYAWTVRTPLTHKNLPDEIGPDNDSMEDPPQEDEDAEAEKGDGKGYIASARISDEMDDGPGSHDQEWQFYQYVGEARKEGALAEHWVSGTIRIKLREGVVTLADSKGNEYKVKKDDKDEDITARLASMAYQKENIQTGRIIEGDVQLTRRDFGTVVETAVGSVIEAHCFERSSLEVGQIMRNTAVVKWRGKKLGSVKKVSGRWGWSDRMDGPWKDHKFLGAYPAAAELAKSQGLNEVKLTPRGLGKMSTQELMTHAIQRGLKVPGDGVTWSRDKLMRHLAADLKGQRLAEGE